MHLYPIIHKDLSIYIELLNYLKLYLDLLFSVISTIQKRRASTTQKKLEKAGVEVSKVKLSRV